MPIRDIIVPETSSSILDPISKQITSIVLIRLGLNNFFENNIYVVNDYTKPSLTNDDDTHNSLISKNRCDVKMTASMNPSEMKWDINTFKYTQAYGVMGINDKTLVPVFVDGVADVRLVEHQMPCTMTLEFSLQFKDREAAYMAINAINSTSLKDSVINYHDLVYEYPLGPDVTQSLEEIWIHRRTSLSPMTFWQYLQKGSNTAIQYIQQRAGDKKELVVKRQALQSYGVLEYNEMAPTIQDQDSSIDRFVVSFTYTLQFARPDVLRLSFPVVIENKLVPEWMIRPQQQTNYAEIYGIFQEKSITRYLRETTTYAPIALRFPEWDDFYPPQQPVIAAGFAQFFSAVLFLEEQGPTTIDMLNLGDHIALHETAIAIMKLQGEDIFQTTGLFNVSIYCNDRQVDPSLLTIDENLVVTLNMTNKSKRYHFVISEAQNLQFLDRKWIPTLIQYRTFFPITLIRNLQILIDQRYCYIDPSNDLLMLINHLIQNGGIDTLITTMIAQGHANSFLYAFATTAEQFGDYLMHHRSLCDDSCLLYDVFVKLCIAQNYILPNQLATGYIRGRNGYPFLPNNVRGSAGRYFNMPLRIIHSVIKS